MRYFIATLLSVDAGKIQTIVVRKCRWHEGKGGSCCRQGNSRRAPRLVVMKWPRLLCGSASMSHNDFGVRCNHFTIGDESNEARDKRTRDRYRQARVSRGGDGEQGSRRVSQARVPT